MPTDTGEREAISTVAAATAAAVGTNSTTNSKGSKSKPSTKTPTLTPPPTVKQVVSKSVTTANATSSSSSSTQNATDKISSVIKVPPQSHLKSASGSDNTLPPLIRPKPNPNLTFDVSDTDVSSIPALEDINEEVWNNCSLLRKYVIMAHYTNSEMDRFEKYALKLHPQEELGNSGPQWNLFSPKMPCPDYGVYIIKIPYTNGTYLVLFGISISNNTRDERGGLYHRIRNHHAAHGVAGEVITIAGDMRGCIDLFEDAMKVTFRGFVPKIVVDGRDIYLHGYETLVVPSSEEADSVALSIVDWAKTYKATGKLSIPACFNNPSGATISLNEGASDFVRNSQEYKIIYSNLNRWDQYFLEREKISKSLFVYAILDLDNYCLH